MFPLELVVKVEPAGTPSGVSVSVLPPSASVHTTENEMLVDPLAVTEYEVPSDGEEIDGALPTTDLAWIRNSTATVPIFPNPVLYVSITTYVDLRLLSTKPDASRVILPVLEFKV